MNGVHRQMQTNHLFVVRADGVLRSLIMTPCAGDPMFPCSLRIPRSALMVLVSTLALAFSMPAQAAYPDRPVRLIVPFPAGGTVDFVARLVATQLGQQLATSVVVENVPGAGGTLATARVAKSAADGYTLLFTTPNHTINPSLISKLPFDTEKDLAPVSLVAEIPELLVAHIAQPFNTFAEFVAHAKANPGKLNYASAGNGTLPHVTMELMLQRLGLQVTHVAYRGAAPALNDLLGGVVAAKMDTIATSSQHMKAGRIKPLAIASLKRSPLMPDVPTSGRVRRAGLSGHPVDGHPRARRNGRRTDLDLAQSDCRDGERAYVPAAVEGRRRGLGGQRPADLRQVDPHRTRPVGRGGTQIADQGRLTSHT
jgi:tripartite-type tricarboxylate transporter receptor subunit TctC